LSLNRVDPRFVLGEPVRRALVLGGLRDWRAGLAATGIELLAERSHDHADLVVAPAALAHDAMASRPSMIILDGRPRRSLRSAGFDVQRLVARPDAMAPALLLPLEQRRASSYAIEHWSVVDRRWKVVRRGVAQRLARRGMWPPVGSIVTVCQRRRVPPGIVKAARPVGLPADVDWVLSLGKGDMLSRNVFHLFRRDQDEPEWVLKFARVPDYAVPFDRDERGLSNAAAAGELVTRRVPQLVGRFMWEGIHASLETAGTGYRLRELLTAPLKRTEKLRLIDVLAEWIVAMGSATAAPAGALDSERARLLTDVLPRFRDHGVTTQLVGGLPDLPSVLQHNDLGSWNVLVRDHDFTVVDWESSRLHGLPFWDLFYFLADALALLDGSVAGETRHEHTVALFRGDAPSSEILFRWTRTAVREFGIPPEAVGALATLCWLHHSLSPVERRDSLDRLASGAEPSLHGTELTGLAWLRDPALGPSWARWRA
jgi:hypothetical protein